MYSKTKAYSVKLLIFFSSDSDRNETAITTDKPEKTALPKVPAQSTVNLGRKQQTFCSFQNACIVRVKKTFTIA